MLARFLVALLFILMSAVLRAVGRKFISVGGDALSMQRIAVHAHWLNIDRDRNVSLAVIAVSVVDRHANKLFVHIQAEKQR